jgi:hypothetical protein
MRTTPGPAFICRHCAAVVERGEQPLAGVWIALHAPAEGCMSQCDACGGWATNGAAVTIYDLPEASAP